MSKTTTRSTSADHRPSARTAWRIGALIAGLAAAVNLVVLALGRIAGADMNVQPAGAPTAMTIGIGLVVVTTVLPVLVGTLLLIAVRGRGGPAWRFLAAAGLVFGLASVAMPVLATATAATTTTLGSMHVVAALAWFVLVWRASP